MKIIFRFLIKTILSSKLGKGFRHRLACRFNLFKLLFHYPTTDRILYQKFENAIARIPSGDSRFLKKYYPLVFDSLTKTCWEKQIAKIDLYDLIYSLDDAPCQRALRFRHLPISGPLKILFVTGNFPSIEHGGGLRVFDMIEELTSIGHEISLYSTFKQAGDAASFKKLQCILKNCRLVSPNTFGAEDFKSWLRRTHQKYHAAHYLWPQSGNLIQSGSEFIENSIFELIESTTRRSLIDLEIALQEKNIPNIEKFSYELVLHWSTEKHAAEAASQVIALTPADSSFSMQVLGISEIAIIPTGVSRTAILDYIKDDDKNLSLEPPPLPYSAIFLGNYHHYPNKDGVQWFLTHVHSKIKAILPDFQFIIAGIGNLKELKQKYNNDPSIHFIGEVPNVVSALRSAKICLAPLITGAGFRGKVIQYAAVGRPTVSTKIGACGTPYIHEKSILISDNPEEFAQCVIRLLTDPALYKQLTQGAREVNQTHYAWEKPIRELEKIYVK